MRNYKYIYLILNVVCLNVTGLALPIEASCKADSIIKEINHIGLSNATKAYVLADELIKIAKADSNNLSLKSQALYGRVLVGYIQGKNDTLVIPCIQTLLKEMNGEKGSFQKSLLYLSLSMIYTTEGKYADAFQCSLLALEYFEQQKDSALVAKTAFTLGNICTYIRSYKMAENYYKQALDHAHPAEFEYYQILLNLSKLLFYTKPIDATIDSMLVIIPFIEGYHDPGLRAIAYLNLATCYVMQNTFDKAFHYYEQALELVKSIENNKILFTLYQGLGSYYFYISDIPQSFHYFYLSKHLALQDGNLEQLSYALYNLGFLYEQTGQVDSSLFYLKQYTEANNQLNAHSGAMEAYQAYVSVFMEASKDKLTIAEQEIQLKNRRFMALAIATIAIIVLAILLFIIFQQKKQQQAMIREAEKKDLETRLEHEQKLKQLQTKRHKEGLDAKAREITSYSLLLSNKNQVLQQIASIAKQLPTDQPAVTEINNIIKSNMNTDQAWGDFMLHFQKIHPKFFQHFKSLPSAKHITENELRLCAYFRIGMSTKQIAQILNVSPESVRIHRYRLKKKLGLGEKDDLDEFIRNIGVTDKNQAGNK